MITAVASSAFAAFHKCRVPDPSALKSSQEEEPRVGGRIVVGVDGSDASIDAFRWAQTQARLTSARLEVVMTWDSPPNLGWPAPSPDQLDPEGEARETVAAIIRSELGPSADIEIAPTLIEGHPAPALLKQAQGADLLVVGSRGHGAFSGMLLGSVSQHVVAHAPCPVVITRHISK